MYKNNSTLSYTSYLYVFMNATVEYLELKLYLLAVSLVGPGTQLVGISI